MSKDEAHEKGILLAPFRPI